MGHKLHMFSGPMGFDHVAVSSTKTFQSVSDNPCSVLRIMLVLLSKPPMTPKQTAFLVRLLRLLSAGSRRKRNVPQRDTAAMVVTDTSDDSEDNQSPRSPKRLHRMTGPTRQAHPGCRASNESCDVVGARNQACGAAAAPQGTCVAGQPTSMAAGQA